MILTRENYYTPEADWEYMSCSQYQSFCECEAKAIAKLEGRWKEEPTEALLVGNYFHSYMEGEQAHQEFCQENFDKIYKTKTDKKTGTTTITGKYKAYEVADSMLRAAMECPEIKRFYDMPGEVEHIMTGHLFGIPWRVRMDKYFPDRRLILDWKTVADIHKLEYNKISKEYDTFAESYGYLMRAAVYSEIEKQNVHKSEDPMFLLAVLSKQDPPDKALISLGHRQRWDFELEQVQKNIQRIILVKNKMVKPIRCGKCDYCRASKKHLRIQAYYDFKPGFGEVEEDEFFEV
ncbi:PD-(D/E)XK nuclease-like domain-containing protein [Massilioclostridium coli]|uniref:PD-(D/E)XK nuclease-like domain-containing protein n=1 Tax=Massilioclostridium coli TaxID=1870991 RepID=UPI0022E7EB74|nr:PD-(D/E)XK nuclease-like domain-containing protein [Massilioclostridium coli]